MEPVSGLMARDSLDNTSKMSSTAMEYLHKQVGMYIVDNGHSIINMAMAIRALKMVRNTTESSRMT